MISNRFVIGSEIDSGNNGRIFKVYDSNPVEANTLKDLVVKISAKINDLAYEIKILKKMGKYVETSECHVPPMIDYGLVTMTNMHEDDITTEFKIKDQNT